jgi:hypothetical protein
MGHAYRELRLAGFSGSLEFVQVGDNSLVQFAAVVNFG